MSEPECEQDPLDMEPIEIKTTDQLDLHMFNPRDARDLVPNYLESARQHGIHEVRIIHGKGSGTLRRIVHGILDRLAYVTGYSLAPHDRGHWGATVVFMEPLPSPDAVDPEPECRQTP